MFGELINNNINNNNNPPSTFLRRRLVKIESRSKMAGGKNHIKYVKSPNCLLPVLVSPCNCCFLETDIILKFLLSTK